MKTKTWLSACVAILMTPSVILAQAKPQANSLPALRLVPISAACKAERGIYSGILKSHESAVLDFSDSERITLKSSIGMFSVSRDDSNPAVEFGTDKYIVTKEGKFSSGYFSCVSHPFVCLAANHLTTQIILSFTPKPEAERDSTQEAKESPAMKAIQCYVDYKMNVSRQSRLMTYENE